MDMGMDMGRALIGIVVAAAGAWLYLTARRRLLLRWRHPDGRVTAVGSPGVRAAWGLAMVGAALAVLFGAMMALGAVVR